MATLGGEGAVPGTFRSPFDIVACRGRLVVSEATRVQVLDPADGTPHQVVTLEGAMNLVGLTILGNPTDGERIIVCDPLAGIVYALRIEEAAASTSTSTLTSASTSTSTLTSTSTSAGTSTLTSAGISTLTSAGISVASGGSDLRIDEVAEALSPLPSLPSLPALDVAPLLQRLHDLGSAHHGAHQSTADALPPLASIAQAPWRAPTSPAVEDDDEPIE